MVSDYPLLTECFLSSPVVDRNGYPYFVNPVSDGIPRMGADLLREVVDGIVDIADLDCDIVLAPEAMGIPLATGITLRTGVPYAVIRNRATVGALRAAGAVVTEVIAVFSKQKDVSALSAELGVPVRYLLAVSSKDGRPALL